MATRPRVVHGLVRSAAGVLTTGVLLCLALLLQGSNFIPSTQTVTTENAATPTYVAGTSGLVPPAAANDILEIIGSASKTVKIRQVQISCTATAAAAYDFTMIKRSTANTGGTSGLLAIVPLDANDAAGTAVIKGYTANPTLGTLIGVVRTVKGTVTTAAGTIMNVPTVFDFGTRSTEALTLRGTAQVAVLNLNGATMTGGSCNMDVEWTED